MNKQYKNQVGLLIKIVPLLYRIKEFAIHGGTAINLFVKNMPRYSIDIDLTYIPIKDRNESLKHINDILADLKLKIERAIPTSKIIHKPDVWKLMCTHQGAVVKIEVNGTKRGIIGEIEKRELCSKAKSEFNSTCVANIVSISQLYGGKVAAALSRQHPRDIFDCKYMDIEPFELLKDGLLLCLLGSDKPIIESLNPNLIDQCKALDNQFNGMTDTEFSYEEFEAARLELIQKVNGLFSEKDKVFILTFEQGEPDWDMCCAGDLSSFPSVKWKLQNIRNLKSTNTDKHLLGIEKLQKYLYK